MKGTSAPVNGVLAGGATIAYLLVFYLISPRLMLNPLVYWGSMVIFIIFMAAAIRRVKEQQEQPQSQQILFREALRVAFTVFIVGNGIYYLFYYLMFKVVDPELVTLQREIFLDNTGWLGKGNSRDLEQQFGQEDFQVTFSNTLFQYVFSLMGGFVLSLALAGFLTRRR